MPSTTIRTLTNMAILGLCTSLSAAEHTKDSLDAVKTNLDTRKAVLIDVREPDEWNRGHLQQAKHIPLSRIQNGLTAAELDELVPKDAIVYLHCAAGSRCLKATEVLSKFQRDLRPLQPGYRQLLQAGFPKAEK